MLADHESDGNVVTGALDGLVHLQPRYDQFIITVGDCLYEGKNTYTMGTTTKLCLATEALVPYMLC